MAWSVLTDASRVTPGSNQHDVITDAAGTPQIENDIVATPVDNVLHYQPLRFVDSGSGTATITQDWMPPTEAHVALAKLRGGVPSGFTQTPADS